MAAVYQTSSLNNNNNNTQKQCTSTSCCSPLRLWRTLQTIIHNDSKDEFSRLCETTPTELITRVLLTSRLSNDPALYSPSQKSRVIQFPIHVRQEAVRKFGKPVTDSNPIQLALVLKNPLIAFQLLIFLKSNATVQELSQFLNHTWGQRNTTLHLACFWNMSKLVRLLVDLGADINARNTRLVLPVDCCTNNECLALLSITTIPTTTTTTTTLTTKNTGMTQKVNTKSTKNLQHRPSMLLKKAAERSMTTHIPTLLSPSPSPQQQQEEEGIVQVVRQNNHHDEITATNEFFDSKKSSSPSPLEGDHQRAIMRMSPMSFSSSSSSSSFSSLSSVEDGTTKSDDLWTPPPSPMTIITEKNNNNFPPTSWTTTTATSDTHVIMGFSSSPPSPVPTRPACFPTIRTNKQEDEEEEVKEQMINVLKAFKEEEQNQEQTEMIKSSTHKESSFTCIKRQVRFDPKTILVDACTRGDFPEFIEMINLVTSDMTDMYNRSLLHIALMNGHEKIAKHLIDSDKIDVNHADNNGWTAAHYASALGLWKCLDHLASLEHIDLHIRTYQGYFIHDCPVTEVDKRRCRLIIERAVRRVKATKVRANSSCY
ncbi:hypothetical protein INT45_009407 [Circinella minor]|uniref:Uncharacterized protein n=1 Tax=Circinella minor TaxID=1195481 RepID=A0A8H7VBA7_9FUNG|nr:hypothetical protein INT45_009407 [Circinella minor]